MKTLLSFERFSVESTDSLLNVKEKAQRNARLFKKLLRKYRILHEMGLSINKANRALLIQNLTDIQVSQMLYARLFMKPETKQRNEKIESLKAEIAELQAYFGELEKITPQFEAEKSEPKTQLVTMLNVKLIIDDSGQRYYKMGRRILVEKDSTSYDLHTDLVERTAKAIEERKNAERKKAKKELKDSEAEQELRAQKKSDTFTEKVNEKKRKD